jgi:hypothetical protein
VTTLTTDTNLAIGDKKIAKGKYSIYVHVTEKGDRALVVNKDLGQPLKNIWKEAPADKANLAWPHLEGYEKSIASKEVARIPLRKEAAAEVRDLFTIALTPSKEGAVLNLAWGNESWSIDVKPTK